MQEKRKEKKVNFKKIGLFNEGNTCYLNSVLQCLFHNDLLTKHILENAVKNDNAIAIEYKKTLENYQKQETNYIFILSFIKSFGASIKMSKFLDGRQKDAFEFMINLLSEIEDENHFIRDAFGIVIKNQLICEKCTIVREHIDPIFAISISCQSKEKIYIYYNENKKKYEVNLGVFFMYSYGEIFSKISKKFKQIICYDDGYVLIADSGLETNQEQFKSILFYKYNERKDPNQPFILILLNENESFEKNLQANMVNIKTANAFNFNISLYDALITHGKSEIIKATCNQCGSEDQTQRLFFEHINNYFIFKINRKSKYEVLKVPLRNLDMKYFLNESKGKDSCKFDLFATIDHYGFSQWGHYVAKVMNEFEQKWYIFDDKVCHEENEDNIRYNMDSLILIYKKNNP